MPDHALRRLSEVLGDVLLGMDVCFVTSRWAHHIVERLLKISHWSPDGRLALGWMIPTERTLKGLTIANVLLLVQGSCGRYRP